ncbi:MAG: hypothetical protein GX591_11440 [Planctomycetes bacterium]|nr:hypothetical protein [Planctomycetota bacterium]
MTKLWSIAANAFVQAIRQPLYTVLLLLTFGSLVFTTAITGYTLELEASESDTRLMVNLGMSTLMAAMAFITVFSASATLAREIEQRTVLTVVTKPVARPIILIGKFLGVAAASSVALYLAGIVLLLTARHGVMSEGLDTLDWVVITCGFGALVLAGLTTVFCNYFFGWETTSTLVGACLVLFTAAMGVVAFVGKGWQPIPFFQGINSQIVVVLVLLWMATMVLTALAVAVSTRVGVVGTLGICVAAYALSLITEPLLAGAAGHSPLAAFAYRVIPNLSYFFALDALAMGQPIGGRYVALSGAYAACYTAGLLALGMALLQTREMDAREKASTAPRLVNLYAWLLRIEALAAMVAALAVLVHLTSTGAETGIPAGVPHLIGLAAIGTAVWLLAEWFGRGSRWAMRLVMFLAAVQLVVSVVLAFLVFGTAHPAMRLALPAAAVLHASYVAAMRLRRAGRAHFGYAAVS